MGLIEFWGSLTQSGGNISHLAHLGGMFFGFFYVRSVRGRRGPSGPERAFCAGVMMSGRRARLRRKFESYMRKRQPRDPDRWVN